MAGVFLLLALTIVMALASFLAGALPLSMSLSQSQLRLISSIGIGILVGTALTVIIPEGIEAVADAAITTTGKSSAQAVPPQLRHRATQDAPAQDAPTRSHSDHAALSMPTFHVGLALIMGFVLMFLVDRLPRHASENLSSPPPPRHISLSNLANSGLSPLEGRNFDGRHDEDDDDGDGFRASSNGGLLGHSASDRDGFLGLGSLLTLTPRQSRSLATTTGLVIHAAADGIAMGASAAASSMKLGFIVFAAIMLHKAPAAFGLTSILLKQGLSKRAARGHLIIFSLASPFGAWATFILVNLLGGDSGGTRKEDGSLVDMGENELSQWWTGMLLLFSGGTFLYVAMHAMQEGDTPFFSASSSSAAASSNGIDGIGTGGYMDGPSMAAQRKQSRPQMRDTLATVAGMLIPLLTQFGHHH